MKNLEGIMVEHFVCACHSPEHTQEWVYVQPITIDKSEMPEMYCHVHLDSDCVPIRNNFLRAIIKPFYRFFRALKYAFGYRCRYGYFDCFAVHPNDVDTMIKFLQQYKEDYNKAKAIPADNNANK